jgi:predicted phage terminase large subunit-like protein
VISEALERDITREVLMNSYYEFFKYFFNILHPGQNYEDNFHVKYLCDILQEEAERMLRMEEKDKDIIVNIPPRTSKSLIVSVLFLPWCWIRNPGLKFITVSFDNQLAYLNSQLSRDVIGSKDYQELFGSYYYVRPDIDSKGYFANNFGGYRLSRTSGQNVTGFSAHIIILDDIDSALSVYSETEREFVHKYYFEALYNRLTPANLGFRINVQQRLHEMDLTGAMLALQPDKYRHICLPAEITNLINPPELVKFYTDGLLDPKRLSRKVLDDFKQTLKNKYIGQYLQAPAPDAGDIFKKEWFDIVEPHTLYRDPTNNPIHFVLDTAYTNKTKNDPTAIITCYVKDNHLYILDVKEVWYEFFELVKYLVEHVSKFQHSSNSKIFIEGAASGKDIVSQLRASTMLNIVELKKPTDDKISRANSIQPIVEGHRVKLVNGTYITNFTTQLIAFPNASHDDMVDAMIHAIQRLLQKSGNPDMTFISF